MGGGKPQNNATSFRPISISSLMLNTMDLIVYAHYTPNGETN